MNCVAAAIGLPGSRIERHFESTWLPGLLPGCDSLLERGDDLIRDFLAEIPLGWSTCRAHRGYLHSERGSGISISKPDPSSCSPPNKSSRSGPASRLLALALVSGSRRLSVILKSPFSLDRRGTV